MTDHDSISRRATLKRIAATGALLGTSGFAFGSGSVGAQNGFDQEITWDQSGTQGSENATLECEAGESGVWNWVLTGAGGTFEAAEIEVEFDDNETVTQEGTLIGIGNLVQFPVEREVDDTAVTVTGATARFTFASPPTGPGQIVLTISSSECFDNDAPEPPVDPKDPKESLELIPICVKPDDRKKGENLADGKAKYCVANLSEKKAKVVWKNEYTNQGGYFYVHPMDRHCFWTNLDAKGKAKVSIYYEDHKIDSQKANTDVICEPKLENPNEYLRLVPICYKKEQSRFRVDNDSKYGATVQWRVYGTDQQGTVHVDGHDSTYFYVDADEGDATVTLHYGDEQIDVKHANDQKKCPPDDLSEVLSIEGKCYRNDTGKDHKDGEAKYCIYNDHEDTLRVAWKNEYTHQGGIRDVPGGEYRCIWADLDAKGKGRVSLHYDDEKIDDADANLETHCTDYEEDDNTDNESVAHDDSV